MWRFLPRWMLEMGLASRLGLGLGVDTAVLRPGMADDSEDEDEGGTDRCEARELKPWQG